TVSQDSIDCVFARIHIFDVNVETMPKAGSIWTNSPSAKSKANWRWIQNYCSECSALSKASDQVEVQIEMERMFTRTSNVRFAFEYALTGECKRYAATAPPKKPL
ncbi:hypothetical protein, partial [Hyphococcus sp.]|uniref:hypothetical protein n=1 Tax=Hyphococcus sp. TaxID=2038636 RepID=UPI0035C6E32B